MARKRSADIDWDKVPLGKQSDASLARELDVALVTVQRQRKRRGIPVYSPDKSEGEAPVGKGLADVRIDYSSGAATIATLERLSAAVCGGTLDPSRADAVGRHAAIALKAHTVPPASSKEGKGAKAGITFRKIPAAPRPDADDEASAATVQ